MRPAKTHFTLLPGDENNDFDKPGDGSEVVASLKRPCRNSSSACWTVIPWLSAFFFCVLSLFLYFRSALDRGSFERGWRTDFGKLTPLDFRMDF